MLDLIKSFILSGLSVSLANGFGDNIKWFSYQDGLKEAYNKKKPIMLIIFSHSCPACIGLKQRFSHSLDIKMLSKNFIMINLEKKEAISKLYKPDGDYVPRILFLDSRGNILTDIYNESYVEDDVKYFYYHTSSIAKSMEKVINLNFK